MMAIFHKEIPFLHKNDLLNDTSRDKLLTSRDNCDTSRDDCDTSRDNCTHRAITALLHAKQCRITALTSSDKLLSSRDELHTSRDNCVASREAMQDNCSHIARIPS